MHPILKSILAVFIAIFVGSMINCAFVELGPALIPPPSGLDLTTEEGLLAAMPLMEPKHFIFPFLAHALGTFIGAYIAARFSENRKKTKAMIIGAVFLIGGIQMVFILPTTPLWFVITDLLLAYMPCAYAGYFFATINSQRV